MKRRQIIILSSIALILLLIIGKLAMNSKGQQADKPEQDKAVKYVKTDDVVNQTYPFVISGHGRVGSSRNLLLIAEVQGKLKPGQVKLKKGSSFNKGQLLFAIDDTEARLSMQARKSGFMTLLASSLPDLKIDHPESFKKWEEFFEKVDVTKVFPELPHISSVKEKTYLASRNILGEYYSIKADENRLEKFKIYAPFNGSFMDVFTEEGTVVNLGSQMARIIEESNLEINIPISVKEASRLKIGDSVSVFLGENDQVTQGKILRIGQYVNSNTQSIDVFVGLTDPKASVYDGMYVEAEIDGGEISSAVKLPRKALLNDNEVYVVKDSILQRHPIQIQATAKDYVYVKGLDNGTNVVVEALTNPTDGMSVKMIPQDE